MREKTIPVKVYPDLKAVFESIRKGVAEDLKKKYGLKEIIVPHTLSSQIVAAQYLKKPFRFKVVKTGMFTGILKIE